MELKKLNYTHDAAIDLMLAHPEYTQGQIAKEFGYTQGWLSQVINSDAFREKLAERREAIVDPVLRMTMDEKIRGAVDHSLQVLMRKMEAGDVKAASTVFINGTRALGYGARSTEPAVVNNYVAVLPPRAPNSEFWAKAYGPQEPEVIEHVEVLNGDASK